MLAYFERVHEGVRGIVTDATPARRWPPRSASTPTRSRSTPTPTSATTTASCFPAATRRGLGRRLRDADVPGVAGRPAATRCASTWRSCRFPATCSRPAAASRTAATAARPGRDGGPGRDAAELGAPARGSAPRSSRPAGTWTSTRPGGHFPDIATDETGESVAPYYELASRRRPRPATRSASPCAGPARRARASPSRSSSTWASPLARRVAADRRAADRQRRLLTAVSQVQVAARQISAVRVSVDIPHTYIGDLQRAAPPPAARRCSCTTGGGSRRHRGHLPDDLTPAEPLSMLAGEPAEGTWSLQVSDSVLIDSGTLERVEPRGLRLAGRAHARDALPRSHGRAGRRAARLVALPGPGVLPGLPLDRPVQRGGLPRRHRRGRRRHRHAVPRHLRRSRWCSTWSPAWAPRARARWGHFGQ